ncbi:MAG: hypothetical protein DRJ43_01990 [Thermoprotei archaeon]|nr:MAG: hypothetical protein DRJ43_01990 [Thermoprotei archaeon]
MRTQLRSYQREALEWALRVAESRGGAVVSLPTGTGKTIVAIAFIEKFLKRGLRALVLEPTRFLVEQTAKRLRYEGIAASMIHSGVKFHDWSRDVVVTTPESALSYLANKYGSTSWSNAVRSSSREFPVVVVDECHHTVGRDPFAQVMQLLRDSIKLGLSALVPRRRIEEIEYYIGPIRRWDFAELEGKGYEKPYMIAEVYEAPLTPLEERVYRDLYELWLKDPSTSNLAALALTTLSRDGCDALRDSADRPTAFADFLLKHVPLEALPIKPHKLATLRRVFEDYEGNFEKALVFVNRRCTAEILAKEFPEMNPVKIIGGRENSDPRVRESLLEVARDPKSRLIIATSAGDEGIDIPEVDLLVFWSHVSSPLRLYQRLGRGLRPSLTGSVKYAVFIVTPGTRDYDALPEGLLALAREGIDVSGIFDDVSSLMLGEGLVMAQKIREVSRYLGSRAIKGETLLYSLLPYQADDRVERKMLRELEEGARSGALLYYYDVDDIYSEIQARIDSGDVEVYISLGSRDRRYAPVEDLDEVINSSPESFTDSLPCIDPVSGLKIDGVEGDVERWLRIELFRLVSSGAKASRISEFLYTLAEEFPAATIKWKFKVSGALIPLGERCATLSLTADYGPFMLRSERQIKATLMNTAALWKLVKGLARGSRGITLCDRMLRVAFDVEKSV